MNKKSTTPVANNISWCVPAAYPISSAIFVVSGLALSSNDVGIAVELPATKITAIVSPNALPIPSITPANIPDLAAGTVTLNIVSINIVHLSNLDIIKLMCDNAIYNTAIYDIDIMAPGPPP